MTKYEFLGDLSRLLADLPEEERKQALHYYEDYFADAGEDNEQAVLTELGSPVEIAEQIKMITPKIFPMEKVLFLALQILPSYTRHQNTRRINIHRIPPRRRMAGIKCPAHKIPVRQAMTDGIRLPAIMITQMEIKLLINRQSSKNPAFLPE